MSWLAPRLGVFVRAARSEDFPAIEGWRAAHFLEMAARQERRGEAARLVSGQTSLSSAAWCVWVDGADRALAAIGFRDEPERKIRWMTDLFSESSRAGLRAGVRLAGAIEEMSDRDGYTMIGETDPENVDYLRHVVSRGHRICLVQFRREPRVRE